MRLPRLVNGHALGAGMLLGLSVSGHPYLIFFGGVAVGVALVFAVRALRRLVAGARWASRAASRLLPPDNGASRIPPLGASTREEDGVREELPAAELTDEERERERRIGLRQGEAAGIRAAARVERREQTRRLEMQAALDRHWQGQRSQTVERVTT